MERCHEYITALSKNPIHAEAPYWKAFTTWRHHLLDLLCEYNAQDHTALVALHVPPYKYDALRTGRLLAAFCLQQYGSNSFTYLNGNGTTYAAYKGIRYHYEALTGKKCLDNLNLCKSVEGLKLVVIENYTFIDHCSLRDTLHVMRSVKPNMILLTDRHSRENVFSDACFTGVRCNVSDCTLCVHHWSNSVPLPELRENHIICRPNAGGSMFDYIEFGKGG